MTVNNNSSNNRFYNLYDVLNDDVIDIIYQKLSPNVLVWTNKKNYLKYHYIVKKMIPCEFYDDYIRDIIKTNSSIQNIPFLIK